MKTRQAALAFLQHHPMAVLSTVSEDGKPWGAAIYSVVDKTAKKTDPNDEYITTLIS